MTKSRSVFSRELAARAVDRSGREWLYIPYDQLSDAIGRLARSNASELGIVLIEAPAKAARRPYHRQKLALVLANQRHFALEQAERGIAVHYVVAERGYAEALAALPREFGPLHVMEAAERELRVELQPLVASGALLVERHEGWLTTRADFEQSAGKHAPWRMDAFYRHVRQRTGLLMDGSRPIGGKYSFDAENRKPWRGQPPAPEPPCFEPDAITREVMGLIAAHFTHHPGVLDATALPATAADAEALWRWARAACLPHFGPFEDALSTRSSGLFHSRVSALLNLHRLLPARLVNEAAADETLPLACREGFVRQILGWREFVRHVHRHTDGFRQLPDGAPQSATRPGDGGFAGWSGKAWPGAPSSPGDGGACPSALDAHEPLPAVYWGEPSGLRCLDHVVAGVWREGWSHHISRLMVLSNLATLLGFEPRELTDWFWVAYADAFDWVVEPNVLAMGSYAVADLMTTKPYVSGAAYINKMSDFCGGCAFDPAENCPITRLYWAFLGRHEQRLARNPRFFGPVASLRKRASHEREEDARIFASVRAQLASRTLLSPASLVRRAV